MIWSRPPFPGADQIISWPAVRRSEVQGGVVATVNASPDTNAVPPAVIVKLIFVEANAVPAVPVPIAPETDPETLKAVELENVMVMVSATDADPPINPAIVPLPVP